MEAGCTCALYVLLNVNQVRALKHSPSALVSIQHQNISQTSRACQVTCTCIHIKGPDSQLALPWVAENRDFDLTVQYFSAVHMLPKRAADS